MVGDNNLSKYTSNNLRSIVAGAGNSAINKCNLLVYIDDLSGAPRLYKVGRNGQCVVDSIRVKTYPEQNSADKDIMNAIITDVFDTYPADEKGLFLWSHGTAWLPSNLNNLRAFGQDGSNWMEINDLKEALPNGLDYIVFDACYMANVEVAYALKDRCGFILGSSAEIMGEGFPYSLTIPTLLSGTSLETRLIEACDGFYNYYNSKTGDSQTANISLVRTAGLNDLASACKTLLSGRYVNGQMVDPSQNGLQLQALDYLTSPYSYSYLYDFADYMSLLDGQNKTDLASVVVHCKTTASAYFANPGEKKKIATYCGLSVYVPQVRNPLLNEWYKQLDWYKAVYE